MPARHLLRSFLPRLFLPRLFLLRWLLLGLTLSLAQGHATAQTPACPASPGWIGNPTPPTEIPGGGSNFCQFYQFAWQWFLSLTAPSSTPGLRNFEVPATYPQITASGVTGDSCNSTSQARTLFVRTTKKTAAGTGATLPEFINQAGDGATIYDQNGNVVFYEMRFSRSECNVASGANFAPNTVEMKLAWRVLKPNEPGLDTYYKIVAPISGAFNNQPQLLGLVGFHLAVSTQSHPEFVWVTFEHKNNSPDCLKPAATPVNGWSFASNSCATCLKQNKSGPPACAQQCSFNVANSASALTGPPTNICRVYRDGSAATDNKVKENLAAVDSLNAQLVGPRGLLTALPNNNPMAVWKNYRNDGAIWVSDITQGSSVASNQRGSLQLASPVMETTFQGRFTNSAGSPPVRSPAVNCFGCHVYQPAPASNTGVSHIFGPPSQSK